MAPELRSKREKRRAEIQEDTKHLLEEVQDFDSEETLCKISTRQARNGIQDAIDLSKEELKDLTRRENNGDVSKLKPREVGSRILKSCIAFRESKGDFPSDPRYLRCKNITIDNWEDFIRDPASKRYLESTRNILIRNYFAPINPC